MYCATQNDQYMTGALHARWGIAIKAARYRQGWTQSEFAARLGVRPSTVCRWEAGSSAPSDENKLRIAAELDEDVGLLFPLVVA
jgi:transcriptional regulator with XRE-family HTH domain